MDVTCINCGASFKAKPRENRMYCGSKCYRTYEATNGKRVRPIKYFDYTCLTCNEPFRKTEGEVNAHLKSWGKEPMYCCKPCAWEGRRIKESSSCMICGNVIPIKRITIPGTVRTAVTTRRLKTCSPECRKKAKQIGIDRARPLADRKISKSPGRHGYVRLRIPRTAERDSYEILEHRYVMEQHIGRTLRPEETVHHKNGDRTFNDLCNLELFSSAHGPGQRVVDKIAFAIEILSLYPEFITDAQRSELAKALDHQAALP